MAYTVFLKRSAEKDLDRLPAKVHDRIMEHLIFLNESPRPIGARKLRGREGYRILYTISDAEKKVEIISVAHRREVY